MNRNNARHIIEAMEFANCLKPSAQIQKKINELEIWVLEGDGHG